jgi:hypothetical protein
MSLAQQVFDHAFKPGREPRSEAYRAGVLACLRTRVDGAPICACPYPAGSAERDAYYAGVEEGRALSPVGAAPAGVAA